jgi:hypothetical protein
MGEFDDLMAMEPGDEWDDYDPAAGPASHLDAAALVAELHLPGIVVHLRGEVPSATLERLAPLADPTAPASDPALVTLTVVAEAPGHRLLDAERGDLGRFASTDDLAVAIGDHLLQVAGTLTARGLLLRAAAVELGDGSGRGVLILDPDDAARHQLVAACVAGGARYLGADRVVLPPGSRSVLAVPTPLRFGAPLGRAQVARATTVDVVVVVDRSSGAEAGAPLASLGGPHGCARLLVDGLAAGEDGQELARAAATLAAGATVWSVPGAAAAVLSATIADLSPPSGRELVVVRRPVPGQPGVVVARFADGGVLADLDRSLVFELADDELATVDALRWPVVAVDPEHDRVVIERLAGLGIDLRPAVSAGVATAPGPASYGLPDSPVGRASRAVWDRAAVTRLVSGDADLAAVLGHGARRGDLDLDQELTAELLDAATRAADRAARVDLVAERVLAALDEIGIEPLLLGEVVAAHDGLLPREMVAPTRVELLLARDEVQPCVEALLEAGAVLVDPPSPVDTQGPPDGLDVAPGGPTQLQFSADGVAVLVYDRLAAGPFGELVDHDELLDRSVPFRLGGRWVASLHPEDRFVWACVRLAGSASPSLVEQRSVVLSAPASRAGMAAALEASARWGATRTVLSAVRSVDAVLPGLSPWLVERANRPTAGPDRRRRRGLRRV